MDRELIEFIQDSFDSVWSLEILLTLYGESERYWQPEQLIDELRSSEAVVRKAVGGLLTAGLILVEEDGRVSYGPASPAQHRLVLQLDEAYRVKPGAVRRVVIQRPSDKLRSFSDAFRIIKD